MRTNDFIDKGAILDTAQRILDDAKTIFSEEDPNELRDILMGYLVPIIVLQAKVVGGLNDLDDAIKQEVHHG